METHGWTRRELLFGWAAVLLFTLLQEADDGLQKSRSRSKRIPTLPVFWSGETFARNDTQRFPAACETQSRSFGSALSKRFYCIVSRIARISEYSSNRARTYAGICANTYVCTVRTAWNMILQILEMAHSLLGRFYANAVVFPR